MQVNVPDIGLVNFPDEMAHEDVVSAIQTRLIPQHQQSQQIAAIGPISAPKANFNVGHAPGGVSAGPERIGEIFNPNTTSTPAAFAQNTLGDVQDVIQHNPTPPANTGLEGLHNTVIHGLQGLNNPLTPILGAAALVPGLQIPVAGLLMGMGAKGIGETAGNLAGMQDPTFGQKVESVGDIGQSALMIVPGLAGTKAFPMAKEVGKLPIDLVNELRGANTLDKPFRLGGKQLPVRSQPAVPPTAKDAIPTPLPIEAVTPSPFDKGHVMPNTATSVDPIAVRPTLKDVPVEVLNQRYAAAQDATRQMMAQGDLQGASKMGTMAQFLREELQSRKAAEPVTFSPATKVGEQIILGQHGKEQAAYDAARKANPMGAVIRGYQGSDGNFYTWPEVTRELIKQQQQQKAKEQNGQKQEQVGQEVQTGGQKVPVVPEVQAGSFVPVAQSAGEVKGTPQGEIPGAVVGAERSGVGGNGKGVSRSGLTKEQQAEENRRLAEALGGGSRRRRKGEQGFFKLFGGADLSSLGFKMDTKVQGDQMYNRMKNKLGEESGAWKWMDKAGLRDYLQTPRTVQEVQDWLGTVGPKTDLVSYGMEGKVSEAKKEYDRMTHEWYDGLDSEQQAYVDEMKAYAHQEGGHEWSTKQIDLSKTEITKEIRAKAEKYAKLNKQIEAEPRDTSPRATTAYEYVSPFSTDEPMPEWTTSKEGRNVQRVDVVIPRDKYSDGVEITDQDKWQPDNLHENLPNTLGWAMIQYKTGPKGEKMAVIGEAQSRWGQRRRALVNQYEVRPYEQQYAHLAGETPKESNTYYGVWDKQAKRWISPLENGSVAMEKQTWLTKEAAQKAIEEWSDQAIKDHPLLHDYNRLILKAAIEQARKEGATHIVVSDAETAMMTEGHDAHVSTPPRTYEMATTPNGRKVVDTLNDGGSLYMMGDASKRGTKAYLSNKGEIVAELTPTEIRKLENNGVLEYTHDSGQPDTIWKLTQEYEAAKPVISQEPGMRLNYDKVLPKIAEELTGSKGERVSLGGHKNAHKRPSDFDHPEGVETIGGGKRDNLIFRNADGTPKTDASGVMYPLDKVDPQKFTTFGKDKLGSVQGMDKTGKAMSGESGSVISPGEILKDLNERFNPFKSKVPASTLDFIKLPDFQSKAAANEMFSKPFGAERIPLLNKVWGGKTPERVESPQNKAIAAWYAERHGVGPAIATAVSEQFKGKLNPAFEVSDTGDLNVIPKFAHQSLKMSDVFEALQNNPEAYKLSKEQLVAFSNMQPLLGRMAELTKQYELTTVTDKDGDFRSYFPRLVTKLPDETVRTGSNKVGAKQSFQKERIFETEQAGWHHGVEYSKNIEQRLAMGVQRLYRAIADKRLALDPALQGKTRGELIKDLKEAYSEELAMQEMRPEQIGLMADSLQSKGAVYSPAFFGRIFKPEVAQLLNKEFAAEQSSLRKTIANANSMLKALQLGFDFGVGQIQLLTTMYNNPRIWAQANFNGLRSMLDKQTLSRYIENNKEPIMELAHMGSSVGTMQEMMTGLGEGQAITKVPVVGDVALAFGRQFQTTLDIAKVEYWKALREVTPEDKRLEMVQTIESILGSSRMESSMVPRNRALLERVALLAPSYYRASVDFVAALGQRGVTGQQARRAMGAFVVGSLATYYGIAQMAGMSNEEIARRLNPANKDFMMWTINAEGKDVNIGIGGIMRSYLKLLGNVISTSIEKPGDWMSLAPEKNPFTRWYRGHAGPTVGVTWNQFSGRDFLGKTTDTRDLSKGLLPLATQDYLDAARGKREMPTKLETGASMIGLSSNPASTALQTISKRARQYEKNNGITKSDPMFFGEDRYKALEQALGKADMETAKVEYEKLLKEKASQHPSLSSDEAIARAKQDMQQKFTGLENFRFVNKENEALFKASLSPDQRVLYDKAVAEQKAIAAKFFELQPKVTKKKEAFGLPKPPRLPSLPSF